MVDNHYLGMRRADYPELKAPVTDAAYTPNRCETCSAPTIGYMCPWTVAGYLILALPLVVMLVLRWWRII